MRFETSQNMQISQQMKLAPRMIQSMEILQMPMLALQERIEEELESNVALEQLEPGLDQETDKPESDDDRREEAIAERELVVGEESRDDSADFGRLSAFESTYGDASDNEYSSPRAARRLNGERDKKMDAMANVAARAASLTDQLMGQWTFAEVEPDVRAAGARLIEYIDDDGLLSTDLETILDQQQGAATFDLDLLERALAVVQHWLEPPGIGARSSREAILIQIDHELGRAPDGADDEAWLDARQIVEEHFDDLLENRLPRIAHRTSLAIERIQRAKEKLSRLKPHPGRELVEQDVPAVIPDVVVEFDEQADAYVAGLSNGLLPALRISRQYAEMSKDRSQEKRTREFAGTSVRNATWLIEAIGQRNNTLLRVVNVVLTRQREFFDHGPQHLKPLPMIEVADQLGIHVGTVSRAVAGKWMQTPRGLVALRKFFSGGTETESGESMSWDAIKATLQEIIDAEDKTSPLSDEKLSAHLKERGIDIARRTVVKYRQQLGIPPARRRKVYE